MKTYETLEEWTIANESHVDTSLIGKYIEKVFNCEMKELTDFKSLSGGYTNDVFTFLLDENKYVYRYPGEGSEDFINRESEYHAHNIAFEMGLDKALVYINKEGHKISKYIEDYRYFDYESKEDVKRIIDVMRTYHNSSALTGFKYDIKHEIENFWSMSKDYYLKIYPDIVEIKERVYGIYETLDYENINLSLSHNDVYTTNILITKDDLYLIDWEFSNDTHPALDLTTFFVCSPYSEERVHEILLMYLEDQNEKVIKEYYNYFIVGSFYWLLWALHVEATGGDTQGFVEKYYSYLMMFLEK